MSSEIAQPRHNYFVSIDDQNLPLGHIFGRIAGLCVLVVHQAQLAALFARGNSVQADVEFGTVRGISVFRMRIRKAKDVSLGFELGALETVLRYLMICRGSNRELIKWQYYIEAIFTYRKNSWSFQSRQASCRHHGTRQTRGRVSRCIPRTYPPHRRRKCCKR